MLYDHYCFNCGLDGDAPLPDYKQIFINSKYMKKAGSAKRLKYIIKGRLPPMKPYNIVDLF